MSQIKAEMCRFAEQSVQNPKQERGVNISAFPRVKGHSGHKG